MTVEDLKFENQSRTTLTPTNSGAKFAWAENDTVGIFPAEGSQIAFPMISGAGTNTATFTGGGWALKTSTPYMAYYPMQGKFYLDKENIFVTYTGQSITENASTVHLGKYDYMVASSTTPAEKANDVDFHFKHLGALVRLKVKIDETSTLTCVTLQTDENDFITSGYIDLTENTPIIDPKNNNKSNTFKISLNNILVEANQELIVYFWMAPVNLNGKRLKAFIDNNDTYSHEISLTGKNFEAGKTYELTPSKADEVETIPNNQIWYTSTYGNNGIPYSDNVFGANIVSNIYKDGKGVITFDSDVTSIGSSAFSDCSFLTSITIPNSVTTIGSNAFNGCNSLESIIIPNSVTTIDKQAFAYCKSLTNINIPNSVTTIGDGAFWCCSFESFIIPNSVTIIGESAFAYCQSLTNITMPNSITTINKKAFEGCESLANITIPSSVTKITSEIFSGCTSLTSISIPNSVTIIERSAFRGCTSLKNVIFPNSLVYIDENAFYDCSSLANIIIPNSVTTIGNSVFYRCTSLTNITIPSSVTKIGNSVFEYCTSLSSIMVENANSIYDSRENCNAIIETESNTVIQGCNNSVIPYGVTNIGNYAFQNCRSLTNITIPNSVTTIQYGAFASCTSLTSIVIPNTVTTIGENAFYGCI